MCGAARIRYLVARLDKWNHRRVILRTNDPGAAIRAMMRANMVECHDDERAWVDDLIYAQELYREMDEERERVAQSYCAICGKRFYDTLGLPRMPWPHGGEAHRQKKRDRWFRAVKHKDGTVQECCSSCASDYFTRMLKRREAAKHEKEKSYD